MMIRAPQGAMAAATARTIRGISDKTINPSRPLLNQVPCARMNK